MGNRPCQTYHLWPINMLRHQNNKIIVFPAMMNCTLFRFVVCGKGQDWKMAKVVSCRAY